MGNGTPLPVRRSSGGEEHGQVSTLAHATRSDVMNDAKANPPVPLTIEGARPAASRISRREAMQWVLGAIAASSLPTSDALAQPVGRTPTPQENASTQPAVLVKGGYGVDPNLVKGYKPGEL